MRLAVLGAGPIGTGLTALALAYGASVWLWSRRVESRERARREVADILARMARKGTLTEPPEQALARLRLADSPTAAVAEAEWAVESVVEDLEAKHALLRQVEPALPPGALLTTTASWLPVSALAQALRHPDRFLNTHFYNPPWGRTVVEVVPGPETSPSALERALDHLRALGRRPALLRRDLPGYVGNRCLFAWLQSALCAVGGGHSPRTVDAGQRFRLGFPLGPCEVMDYIRLDLVDRILRVASAWGWEVPPPARTLLDRMLAEGRLGAEVGQGFYHYPNRRWHPQDLRPEEAEGADPLALFAPLAEEAGRLLREGVADPEAVDAIGVGCVGWHRGPVALAREVGRPALERALGRPDGVLDALFAPA